MFEESLLAEQFQKLLDREREAAEVYADLATRLTDPALREQVAQIYREKQRHIELTERLLEIVG